ncbi:MAG TPA: ABC transporter permease [Clostridia bacterium]|jgi:simple sugar transport system permease protein|nr:ABC transporter permease [Clostridia bacterium]
MGEQKRKKLRLPFSTNILASLISIGVGLIVGLILIYVLNAKAAGGAFISLITTGFRSSDKFAKVLYQAAPLIMTGLSVGFAFKTGLFNIGATGQYTVGAAAALIGAIQFQLPWYVCLLLAMIGGAVWGIFPGLFKARFNVNEVITSIMFNWIAMFAVNLTINNLPMMLAKYWGGAQMDRTANLAQANPGALIPRMGLDVLMKSNYMNISIFIAIAFAIVAWIILSKTTFGYELKACGYNRNASIYAGINAKRNIVLSMVIAGAFAGVGGGLYFLAGTGQYTLLKQLLAAGFNGIPVALLATSNPIGTIFSAFFVSYIQVGGDAMQPDFVKEIIDIIISVIIYLAAFALLTRELLARGKQRHEEAMAAAAAPAVEVKDEVK